MPNWCENDLTISGPEVQKVLAAIRSPEDEYEDERLLDFDRIIPYPEEFKALDRRNQEYQQKLSAINKEDPERAAKLSTLAAEYGAEPGAFWLKDGFNSGGYEWCINNWGTKWNACRVSLQAEGLDTEKPAGALATCAYCQTTQFTSGLEVLACRKCGGSLQPNPIPDSVLLTFETAWSPPAPVIERLASMFPEHAFELAYYECGMGFCGRVRWENGLEQSHHQAEYDGLRGG